MSEEGLFDSTFPRKDFLTNQPNKFNLGADFSGVFVPPPPPVGAILIDDLGHGLVINGGGDLMLTGT